MCLISLLSGFFFYHRKGSICAAAKMIIKSILFRFNCLLFIYLASGSFCRLLITFATVWIQIRADRTSVLMLIQTV